MRMNHEEVAEEMAAARVLDELVREAQEEQAFIQRALRMDGHG